jgi:hypothetical protein
MVVAVRKRVPTVAWRAGLRRVHAVLDELFQEFFPVADDVGLDWYDPAYTYGQYVTRLLFEAAERLGGTYPADPRGAWTTAERVAPPVDLDEAEGEEQGGAPTDAIGRFIDPLQTHGQVLEVMAEWSDPMRSLALSAWADGLPITELAATLNQSTNALNLRLRRARMSLSARTGASLRLRRPRARRPADGDPRGGLDESGGSPGDSSPPGSR